MHNRKSLRALAKELGVSHSYLSQVKHGKRPASEKIAQALNGKQVVSSFYDSPRGESNPLTYRLQVGCAAIAPLGRKVNFYPN